MSDLTTSSLGRSALGLYVADGHSPFLKALLEPLTNRLEVKHFRVLAEAAVHDPSRQNPRAALAAHVRRATATPLPADLVSAYRGLPVEERAEIIALLDPVGGASCITQLKDAYATQYLADLRYKIAARPVQSLEEIVVFAMRWGPARLDGVAAEMIASAYQKGRWPSVSVGGIKA